MSHHNKQIAEYAEERSLKESIISQARVVYGSQYPTGHTFDIVITECYDEEKDGSKNYLDTFVGRLLVYTRPNSFTAFTVIMRTQRKDDQMKTLQSLDWAISEKTSVMFNSLNEDEVEWAEAEDD